MMYFTLDLFRIVQQPITNEEIARGLALFFPPKRFVFFNGFIGYVEVSTFYPLCFRNINGAWSCTSLALRSSGEPSAHFLGINPSCAAVFRKAFPDRMESMMRQFQLLVSN